MAKKLAETAANIVKDAGGRVVGRTRLQKMAYLMELAGVGEQLDFHYRHFGPYSEELADGIRDAKGLGLIAEEQREAAWGGWYSIYEAQGASDHPQREIRQQLAETCSKVDPIVLELAMTAAYLAASGEPNAWELTRELKPLKAKDGRLEEARRWYEELRQKVQTPKELPTVH